MASTRGLTLAEGAAPPWLTDKATNPFKKVKAALAFARSPEGPKSLKVHRKNYLDLLMVSLDAFEKHRDEIVERAQGKGVSTVRWHLHIPGPCPGPRPMLLVARPPTQEYKTLSLSWHRWGSSRAR